MFKSYGNNISIPNNYVYTSNKGTEYMYLDGSWMNCSTLNIVESTHNFKMNKSATQQIAEHNSKNNLQIGKKYIFNESAYVYVGRDNFTFNGNLLNESINKRVKNLFEAEDTNFSDLKLGDKSNDEVPSYFKMGDYVYSNGGWFHNGARVAKKGDNLDELMADAKDYIKKINNNPNETLPVGSTVQYKGNTLTFVGDALVDLKNNKEYPSVYVDRLKEYAKSSEDNNSSNSTEQDNSTSDENSSPESSNTQSNSSVEVPNGYVYTSGKGKKYFKKNGQWISAENKKPINSSSAIPLERAAQAAIQKHNQTEPVKIGTEWKSKKGQSYKYVGNGRFISDSGKLLPQDIAKKVLDNLSQDSSEQSEQNTDIPEVQIDGDNSSQEQSEQSGNNEQQPKPSNSQPQGETTGLEGLADKIKAAPANTRRRITVLLSRGDDISLLAADILLAGKQSEASQILNSLNNKD